MVPGQGNGRSPLGGDRATRLGCPVEAAEVRDPAYARVPPRQGVVLCPTPSSATLIPVDAHLRAQGELRETPFSRNMNGVQHIEIRWRPASFPPHRADATRDSHGGRVLDAEAAARAYDLSTLIMRRSASVLRDHDGSCQPLLREDFIPLPICVWKLSTHSFSSE